MKSIAVFGVMLALSAAAALACNVPVFRYALERWEPDRYEVTIFHRGPLEGETKAIVAALQTGVEQLSANVNIQPADVAALEPPLAELWKSQANATLPWMIVQFPEPIRISWPAWAGPLTTRAAGALLDSPSRREVVRRIAGGDSAVWLLLEGVDQKQNDAVVQTLETASRRLEKQLKLPEPDPGDPRISADIELKIAFSTVRISRTDPREALFVAMLMNADKSLQGTKEPVLFPMFGRGRALAAIPHKEITGVLLEQAASFMAGACSCEVKSLNPGVDLLFAADWDRSLQGRAVKDPELPPLIGMGQFAAPPVAPAGPGEASKTEPEHRSTLARNLAVAGAIGLLALVIGTAVVKTRTHRPG